MFNPETQLVILLIGTVLAGSLWLFSLSGAVLVARTLTHELLIRRQRGSRVMRMFRLLWWLTKWPALAELILEPFFHLALHEKMGFGFWMFEAVGFFNWWCYRNAGDDDDYKNLKKKLNETVKVLRGRLVVVAEPA